MSFGVVSSGARSPTALRAADGAGLMHPRRRGSSGATLPPQLRSGKYGASGVRGWETVTWCLSICAPLMHSALPFYSFWPVSKNGEVSVPKIAFGGGYRLLFYPTGIRLWLRVMSAYATKYYGHAKAPRAQKTRGASPLSKGIYVLILVRKG